MQIVSQKDFDSLSPYGKGYAIYMYGMRLDEPYVPQIYEPAEEEVVDYERGKFQAMLDIQDLE